MQPLESVNLESLAVTKRAARGNAGLVEQVVGLRALVEGLDWTTQAVGQQLDWTTQAIGQQRTSRDALDDLIDGRLEGRGVVEAWGGGRPRRHPPHGGGLKDSGARVHG